MVEIKPETSQLCADLLLKPRYILTTQDTAIDEIRKAVRVGALNLAFWRDSVARYLVIFRWDRKPLDEEILPYLQALFEDGQIQESYSVFTNPTMRGFIQSREIWMTQTIADQMANSVVDFAEKKDDGTITQ